jgi:transcriptional regulator with PAS, ATPase and Fis domain
MKILLAWIGRTDLDAAAGVEKAGLGPIGQVVEKRQFDRIILLCNYEKVQMSAYKKWIAAKTKTPVVVHYDDLKKNPTDFGLIYQAVIKTILDLESEHGKDLSLTFHLSPGTPAMAAVWIIVAKTRYPAELIQSSREQGVETVSVPFEISAEFIPTLMQRADEQLERAIELSPAAEFSDIRYQSSQIEQVVEQAKIFALHTVSILIQGESGTGKELFANAIHRASPRAGKPFVPVNCGAIPRELIESELFGHKKGAFTGADKDRTGHFKEADGGTIFLDEIGELPPQAQVRLLRVLQEKEITPVGASSPQKIDVRVISATNRNLLEETAKGNFREDLFYRLAVLPLYLPPLRDRHGDISHLVEHFLEKYNLENTGKFWKDPKRLAPSAKNLLMNHQWKGNVRELQNTIFRSMVLTKNPLITEADIRHALFKIEDKTDKQILDRPLSDSFSIETLISEVAAHYLNRALEESGGNKTKAAKLVGLANYQTFDNWMKRYQNEP